MKRAMILMAVFCLLAAVVFTGCNRASSSGSSGEITLTMINRVNSEVAIENNQMFQHIREKYGFNIILEAPPINNYNERLQLIMASGDLPDLVYVWGLDQNYLNWAEQGLLNPVDDLIRSYPNIMHNISTDMIEMWRVPAMGKTYGVPRPNKVNRWGYMANVQWLNKLGVSAPATLDEFYELGKLVRDNDPNGTGRADTFLISPDRDIFANTTSGTPVLEAFLPPNGAPDFDGVYKIRQRQTGYWPFLDYMRRLYAEGIIDPEYITNATYGGRDKVMANRVAIVGTHDSVIPQDPIQNNNGAFDWLDFFPPLKNFQNGTAYNYVGPAVWGVWALPASSNKTQDALRFLDWGNSPQGYEILYNGVPGVTYNSYDLSSRTIDQTAPQRSLWNTVSSSYVTVAFAYEGIFPYCSNDPAINAYYNKSLENYLSVVTEMEIPSIQNPEMNRFNAANPDLITRCSQLENLYVTGGASRTELEDFLNNQWFPRIAAAEAEYQRIMASRN